jgi:hypothetical protein
MPNEYARTLGHFLMDLHRLGSSSMEDLVVWGERIRLGVAIEASLSSMLAACQASRFGNRDGAYESAMQEEETEMEARQTHRQRRVLVESGKQPLAGETPRLSQGLLEVQSATRHVPGCCPRFNLQDFGTSGRDI